MEAVIGRWPQLTGWKTDPVSPAPALQNRCGTLRDWEEWELNRDPEGSWPKNIKVPRDWAGARGWWQGARFVLRGENKLLLGCRQGAKGSDRRSLAQVFPWKEIWCRGRGGATQRKCSWAGLWPVRGGTLLWPPLHLHHFPLPKFLHLSERHGKRTVLTLTQFPLAFYLFYPWD